MDKYLPEILKESNTVIIPEIGALTVTNPSTGELMFMSYLKHDDGKFAKYIAEKEGVDVQESANMLAKFIREMIAKLDQGEVYKIFKFGSFIKEADGSISFNQWQDAGDTTSELKPILPDVSEPIETIVEKLEESVVDNVFATESIDDEYDVQSSIDLAKEPEEIPAIELKKEFNIAEKEELAKNVEKLATLKKQKENKSTHKRKSPVFYLLIGILVILISGGVYIGINFQDFKQQIPFLADQVEHREQTDHLNQMKELLGKTDSEKPEEKNDNSENKEPVQKSETDPAEKIENTTEKPNIQAQKAKVPISTGISFHLIAGVFSVPENAQRMADKLGTEGYPAVVVVRGAQHLVKMQSFSSKEEAIQAIAGAKNHAPKVWLLSGKLD